MINEKFNLKNEIETVREDCLRPTQKWGRSTQIWIGCLLIVMSWGLYCYIHQLKHGLGVTAMRDYVSWGLYISCILYWYQSLRHSCISHPADYKTGMAEAHHPLCRVANICIPDLWRDYTNY